VLKLDGADVKAATKVEGCPDCKQDGTAFKHLRLHGLTDQVTGQQENLEMTFESTRAESGKTRSL
jgi:hypothetical protein